MTVTRREGSALAIRDDQEFFTDKQIAALRQLGVQDAGNADLAVFFHHSQRTGLDPFARQIYMIGRWSKDGTKWTIQTSIDGFRLIGRRAANDRGETLEVTDTEWCGEDGVWRDVWLSSEPPAAARVAIIRNGGRFPAVAMFREYAQTKRDGSLTQMWSEKGTLMIAKCAEALAWRKAFPQDLSGLYTADEMGRANERDGGSRASVSRPSLTELAHDGVGDAEVVLDAEVVPDPETGEIAVEDKPAITARTRGRMFALLSECGIEDEADQRARMSKVLGREVESRSSLTEAEAKAVIAKLSELRDWQRDHVGRAS